MAYGEFGMGCLLGKCDHFTIEQEEVTNSTATSQQNSTDAVPFFQFDRT